MALRAIPASTGFKPSFESTLANRSLIVSPFLATIVSLFIHTLPDSILVGKPTLPSWLIIGPGGIPVLPAGTITSMAATSPVLADIFTLLCSSRSASLNGFRFVSMSTFEPVKSGSIFSIPALSSASFRALWTMVFLTTFVYTLPRSFFLISCSCAARTFCRLATPNALYSLMSAVSASASFCFSCSIGFSVVIAILRLLPL